MDCMQVEDVMARLRGHVDKLNAELATALPPRGPCSKWVLPAEDGGARGRLELSFFDSWNKGVACSLESKGNYA